jgi:hypothetical protein
MSRTHNITKAKAFNASKISYREAVINKRGGKSVQIQLDGQPLVLQIPLMLTWGVNERVDEQSGRVSYDLALQFNDHNPAVVKFLDSIKEMEDKIKNDSCGDMCKTWHGKSKMSREVIDALMYPILKYPRIKDAQGKPTGDPDYSRSPTMKIKIPFWEGKFNVEIYSMDKKQLYPSSSGSTPVDVIPKASHINGLIQCTGIWFAGGKCGVTWKLVQSCVRPPARLLGTGTCHIEDDSDDEAADDNLSKKEVAESAPTFDDEDDVQEMEDDASEEEEPEPEPAPKKKKKIVRRKKKSSD